MSTHICIYNAVYIHFMSSVYIMSSLTELRRSYHSSFFLGGKSTGIGDLSDIWSHQRAFSMKCNESLFEFSQPVASHLWNMSSSNRFAALRQKMQTGEERTAQPVSCQERDRDRHQVQNKDTCRHGSCSLFQHDLCNYRRAVKNNTVIVPHA